MRNLKMKFRKLDSNLNFFLFGLKSEKDAKPGGIVSSDISTIR